MKEKDDLEAIMKQAIAESVWTPPSIETEPSTDLFRWAVKKVPTDVENEFTIHFVGWTGYEGRVSSSIQSYDPTTKVGISRSGRRYKLVGPSGMHLDASYVWSRWLSIYKISDDQVLDVTSDYNDR